MDQALCQVLGNRAITVAVSPVKDIDKLLKSTKCAHGVCVAIACEVAVQLGSEEHEDSGVIHQRTFSRLRKHQTQRPRVRGEINKVSLLTPALSPRPRALQSLLNKNP